MNFCNFIFANVFIYTIKNRGKMLIKRNYLIRTVILYSIFFYFFANSMQVVGQEEYKKIEINNDLRLIQLNEHFYIHVSWVNSENFGRFPSNGLLLVKNGKALIIDTPMEESLTADLYNYLLDSMKVKIEEFIAGHSHNDCMGGIAFLHEKNVHSIALDLTKQKCIEQKLILPKQTFSDSLIFKFYGEVVKCIYTGPGHTEDNISVYFPNRKILFGGCMIKSLPSRSLGNTADAVVSKWDSSVEKLKLQCSDAKIVVPGHGGFGDIGLLDHTIKLVKENK
jgi:metallo-beta-lactamase class B